MQNYDFSEVLESSAPLSNDDIKQMLSSAIGAGAPEFRRAVEQVVESAHSNPSLKVRASIGLFFMGQAAKAANELEDCGEGIGHFYRAQALSTLGRYEEAANEFELASKGGFQPIESILRKAGQLRRMGQLEEAEQLR